MKLKVRKIDVQREIQRLRAATGADYKAVMRDLMKTEGRLLVSSSGKTPGLVQVTAPHSQSVRGLKARVQGETAVSSDINKVYGSPQVLFSLLEAKASKAAAKGFWAAVVQSDWAAANEISVRILGQRLREFDDGAAHDRLRDKRTGRVHEKVPSYFVAQKPKGRSTAAPWVAAYIKEKAAKVGTLAAAVVKSAESVLGPLKGVPSFVRRHARKGGGTVDLTESKMGYEVTVANLNPRMQSDLQRKFNSVLGYRLNALQKKLPFIVRSIEKKLAAQLKD
jgi:hypothetical protein